MTGEWYDHDGQSWPEHAHPEDKVEVVYRDGMTDIDRVEYYWSEIDLENEWVWIDGSCEIVKYRLVGS